jgi:hypothetical protein
MTQQHPPDLRVKNEKMGAVFLLAIFCGSWQHLSLGIQFLTQR